MPEPEIISFTGTWDSTTADVTLSWNVANADTISVGELNAERAVTDGSTSRVIPNQRGRARTFRIMARNAEGEVRESVRVSCVGPVVAVVVPVVVVDHSVEGIPYVNNNFEWLTYETVLNKPKFRKSNQPRQIGLYAASMLNMQIWVRTGIPPEAFAALCEAFFPDHTQEEIQQLSDRSWWWKQQQATFEQLKAAKAPYYRELDLKPPDDDIPAMLPETQAALVGSRAVQKIYLPRYAVMPYNYWDNDEESRALGTNGGNKLHPFPMIQIKDDWQDSTSWQMWRTASRSSVMKVSRVKPADTPWPRKDWSLWSFFLAGLERDNFKNETPNTARYTNALFKAEVTKTAQFQLATKDNNIFSIKTGVAIVGYDVQREKENIGVGGEWLVGCMRSDTINAIEQLAKPKQRDIVVQTEIMMVMERNISPAMKLERFGTGNMAPGEDGVAVRDLTVLNKDRHYIPPLSIPFIDKDMKTLTEEFAHVGDADWCGFWQRHWAETLGRAQGLFMVQYGMQLANPNVQNFLIEFPRDPGVAFADYVRTKVAEPVRMVIRDVADALLIREVAWALFGPDEPCPQDTKAELSETTRAALARMPLPVLRYNFRSVEQGKENETGSTNWQFGPPGVNSLWHRFSGFYVGHKPLKNSECPKVRLHLALKLTATWGVSHSAAYVRAVEKALGTEFGDIRWDEVYDEDHHPDRYWIPSMGTPPTSAQCEVYSQMDVQWEDALSAVIHEFLRDKGRSKICDYHNRGWVDADVKFGIRLVDQHNRPQALRVIYYSAIGDETILGTRITDEAGEIPFYERNYTELQFWVSPGALRKRTSGDGASRRIGDKVSLEKVGDDGVFTIVKPAATVNKLGEINITAPVGDLFGAAYVINATATADAGATIVSVAFLVDGEALTAPVTGTYTTTMDSTVLVNGPHKLTATATDDRGVVMTSTFVIVKVNNPLPTVVVSAPPAGPFAGTATLTAVANAGAGMTLASVQFKLDGKDFGGPLPGSSASSTYNSAEILSSLSLKTGDVKITAVAKDTVGHTTISDAVTVKIANPAPQVRITSPGPGAVTGTFEVEATATPGSGMTLDTVEFKIAGKDSGTSLRASPFKVSVNTLQLKNGNVALQAVAKDTAGNTATSDTVTVIVKNEVPAVVLTSPGTDEVVGKYFTLSADVTAGQDMTIASVQFLVDEGPRGEKLTAPPFELHEVQLAPARHEIVVRATDTAGNMTSEKKWVLVKAS
jgi:hypothetical protein